MKKSINVLMIGPARNVKGGMTTVVDNYYDYGLSETVNLKYIESCNDSNKISKYLKELKGINEYKKCIDKYDIVHIHMASRRSTYRKIKYIKIAKKHNKLVVVHIHGGEFSRFFDEECNDKQREYIKYNLNQANKVVVLSEKWKCYFSKIIDKDRIEIITNGVNLPPQYDKDLSNKNILFLGRICEKKGIFDLLQVVEKMKRKYSDVCLYIAGSGNEEKINKTIAEYNLKNNVKLLGWINKEKKDEILKKCAYFVLPSYFEAMPMSILEAMSYKCIVISTSVGSIPKIIKNNQNGMLVKPGDVEAIENYLDTIFNNEKIRIEMSEKARKTIESEYNIEVLLKKIETLYDNLLQK